MRCVIGSLLQRMASVASVRQRLYTLGNLVEVGFLRFSVVRHYFGFQDIA